MLKSIKNNGENEEALESIYMLVQKRIKVDSNESPELHNLVVLVKEYKNEHIKACPNCSNKFLIEQMEIRNSVLPNSGLSFLEI
ncbi:MAG: hypothetical protein ACTHKY_16970 [Ginsengibacter sp.]